MASTPSILPSARRNADGVAYPQPFEDGDKPINRTRIKATYDFSIIRYLLREGESATERLTPPQQRRLAKAQERIGSIPLDSQQSAREYP